MVSIHPGDRKDDAMTTTTHRPMPLENDAVSTLVLHPSTSRLAKTTSGGAGAGDHELWQEPARGGCVDAAQLALPWRDLLRMIHADRAPQPPIAYLSGRRLVDLREG